MSYTDLTATFVNKLLNSYQNGQLLVDNDNYLYEMLRTYRRPNLKFVDNQFIDLENNVPTDANATKIIFPDGNVRTVSETVTSIQHQYRRLDRTATTSLTAPYDSGAASPANNKWVAIYAVKTTDDSTKFVMVGTLTLPVAANQATLDASYGTNGWVYLGLVRNGDFAAAPSGWLDFVQCGRVTLFKNTVTSTQSGVQHVGIQLASGSQTLTYTYAAGTGTDPFTSQPQIPDNIGLGWFGITTDNNINDLNVRDSAPAIQLLRRQCGAGTGTMAYNLLLPVSFGINGAGSNKMDFYLNGFIDNVLGVAGNPQY